MPFRMRSSGPWPELSVTSLPSGSVRLELSPEEKALNLKHTIPECDSDAKLLLQLWMCFEAAFPTSSDVV